MKRLLLTAAAVAALAPAASAQNVHRPARDRVRGPAQHRADTKRLHDGDTFTLTEHEGFFHHAPAALKGATIDGHVENVSPAQDGSRRDAERLLRRCQAGRRHDRAARREGHLDQGARAESHHLRDLGLIVGGAVSATTSPRKGMKHGGLAGAAAGFALATSLKSNIDVKRGTILHLRLNATSSRRTSM